MSEIKKIIAMEILDSRGNPTVEAEVTLTSGEVAYASVPSGASTGSREALELRDQDKKRFLGKGVVSAVKNINTIIANKLIGMNVLEQSQIDNTLIELDGTPTKKNLGANSLLAVSLACAKASALFQKKPLFECLGYTNSFLLPVPMMNIINGGAHADNNLDIQEFMILPLGLKTFSESLRAGVEIFQSLKSVLKQKKLNTNVGDEGGFAPNLAHNEEALDVILKSIQQAGYTAGKDIYLGLDVASNELYTNGKYQLHADQKTLTKQEWIEYLTRLVNNYPIISIEDGMAEDDWEGWSLLTQCLGNKVQLVGDDLFVTNTEILQKGIEKNIANAILIKPNQIGTLTETLSAISLAKKAHYNTIISHRSGETEDTTIAHIAVGTHAGQIKTGSLCRTDRVAKYNELLRIENKMGTQARYAGKAIFSRFLEKATMA